MSHPPESPDFTDMTVAADVAFFAKALTSFVKSNAKFNVVCSVGRRHVFPPSSSSAAVPSPLMVPTRQRSQIHNLVILDSSFNPPTLAHMGMVREALQFLQKRPATQIYAGSSPSSSSSAPSADSKSTRLLLLLSVNNADKAPKPATFEERLALMLAMARDTQTVLASLSDGCIDIPIDIGLTSEPFFHNKSNVIATDPFYNHPDSFAVPGTNTTPHQYFLLGFDTLIRIFDQKYYKTASGETIPEGLPPTATPMQILLTPLMRRAHLHITTRPDSDWGDEKTQLEWVASHVDGLGGPTERWSDKILLFKSGAETGASAVSSTVAREASRAHDTARLEKLVGPAVRSWLLQRLPYEDLQQ
ncbi:hypothetical protein SEPCBS57363_006651 [Sporothrix epigloea]|uniref:Nicotinamide-nucleotide adenylyltransferase n=1 Tax=Sporothrix epigloea TaxID=1892477 RepID=A0ABP0E635_9PEZI